MPGAGSNSQRSRPIRFASIRFERTSTGGVRSEGSDAVSASLSAIPKMLFAITFLASSTAGRQASSERALWGSSSIPVLHPRISLSTSGHDPTPRVANKTPVNPVHGALSCVPDRRVRDLDDVVFDGADSHRPIRRLQPRLEVPKRGILKDELGVGNEDPLVSPREP